MSVTLNAPSEETPAPRSRFKTWFWRISLLVLGLTIGIGGPYLWQLDKQVREEFAQLQWQVPTRIFARPLFLAEGVRLSTEAMELELAAASYRNDGVGQLPGTFKRDGGKFTVSTREFIDMDGPVRDRHLLVVISSGRVLSVQDTATKKRLDRASPGASGRSAAPDRVGFAGGGRSQFQESSRH